MISSFDRHYQPLSCWGCRRELCNNEIFALHFHSCRHPSILILISSLYRCIYSYLLLILIGRLLHYNNPTRHVKHFQTTRRSTEPPPPPPPPPLPPPAPPPTSSPGEQVVATTSPLMPSPTLPLNPSSELITSADTTSLDLLQGPDAKSSPNKAAASGGGTKATKPQNHTCQECGKNFLTAFQLNKHKLGHSHNNCEKCDAKFAKRRLLVHHLKTVHYIATAEKYYSCNFCSRKFVKKPSLWGHLAEHTSGEQVVIISNHFKH